MSDYLCFRCGPYRFLLDIRHVVELGDATEDDTAQASRRRWRDGSLPLLDLASFLGAARPARAQQIVVEEGEGRRSIVDVEVVEGLRDLPPEAFARLAPVSPALDDLVDAVALDPATGASLLRLRHPFAWTATPVAEATA